MGEITLDSFKETLDVLIDANPHARNKGDDFKAWSKENFDCDARISHVKEQRQITNRVSEQFRYFAPIVVFVCVPEVKRDKLIEYILARVYKELENVAIIGVSNSNGEKNYTFEHLIVFKQSNFTEWAKPFFDKVEDAKVLKDQFGLPSDSIDESEVQFAWYVGTTGNDENGQWHDFSDEYIDQGIWVNGWDNKFLDVVKLIKVGDRIAIKSVFNQKNNLPFDNHGRKVGAMRLKAIGTVTENHEDGKTIKVDWTRLDPVKTWYGPGTLRQTIHKVSAKDGLIKKQLLDFTFADEEQDYSLCEEYYTQDVESELDVDALSEVESVPNVPVSSTIVPQNIKPYDKEAFLKQAFMTSERYDELVQLLSYKKNIILQGAPGVGKTFLAKRFAYSLIGATNDSYVEMVQFHQSYSYEDFIMGYKPTDNGFILKTGIFYDFCKRAEQDTNQNSKYYFIIDEINRGNLSKIFGELMMLAEGDKRGEKIKLAYRNELFGVPKNVFIIGMMNTADRSLAIMDYALRRRFSFFDVEPAFDKPMFKNFIEAYIHTPAVVDKVVQRFTDLNKKIADEETSGLGKGFCVGHSYFCVPPVEGQTDDAWYNSIIKYEISPLLDEYWWDDKNKAEDCKKELLKD